MHLCKTIQTFQQKNINYNVKEISSKEYSFNEKENSCQIICPVPTALEKLSHAQPATPLQTDNNTASVSINDMVEYKCCKAVDMHFYCI